MKNPDQEMLSDADLRKLSALDTCTVSNAIERLSTRLRNEGFVAGVLQCQFPDMSPVVGYAATARIRTSGPPMEGTRCYFDRMDWWNYVTSVPAPRMMVLQDADRQPGVGAFMGEIHAAIGAALNCVGCVTNGAVRDLPAVKARGLQLFAGSVAVSHSYAHIAEFGKPVEIGGLQIKSGDLIHGDRHGVHSIPLDIAASIPAEASRILSQERELIDFCGSSNFSIEELPERLRRLSGYSPDIHRIVR
jgi:4-hydroxy-4-methyl-2-oxoglutarate aldolase